MKALLLAALTFLALWFTAWFLLALRADGQGLYAVTKKHLRTQRACDRGVRIAYDLGLRILQVDDTRGGGCWLVCKGETAAVRQFSEAVAQ